MQAFLITAYKDFDSLKELTAALSRHGLCFVHADRRGTITAAQIDELNTMPNVRAIRKRKVNWGSIEHLYAMLDPVPDGFGGWADDVSAPDERTGLSDPFRKRDGKPL